MWIKTTANVFSVLKLGGTSMTLLNIFFLPSFLFFKEPDLPVAAQKRKQGSAVTVHQYSWHTRLKQNTMIFKLLYLVFNPQKSPN